MRKLIPLLFLGLLAAASASAQETYSLQADAPSVVILTDLATFNNARTCLTLGLAVGCTQAQACTAANAAGGASCTAAQARAANVRIWPATLAGREEYVMFQIAVPRFNDLAGGMDNLKEAVRKLQIPALSTVTKNSACSTMGLPAGCFP